MEQRALGGTGYEISVVGFGAWQIGGPGGGFAWPAQPEELSVASIHAALDQGITWIDTAPAYGLGRSEEIVGRAVGSLDERPLVFTKCSLVWDGRGRVWSDLTPPSIRREAAESLRRLRVDAIDLYQIHWPYPDEQLEDAWATLAALRDEGLVRAIGVSNASVAQLTRLEAIAPVASVQPPYSLLRRGIERELLPHCRDEGIGVIAYSPLASGLLSGTMSTQRMASLPADDWRRHDPMFREPHLSQHLAVADLLRALSAAYEASPAEVAIAWVLSRPAVTGAIVGISRPEQVGMVGRATSLGLTEDDLASLESQLTRTLRLPEPPDRFRPRTRDELEIDLAPEA